jgi:pyruvate dehydrogenase E1 component beta subunit
MRELTYAQAGVEAVAEEMRKDPRIFYMSTDPIMPLVNEFGDKRIKATPIAEGALTGIAIGAAGSGYRPIMDWRQVTFSFVAMDQIVNQAAKIHYVFDVHEPVGAEDVPALDARRPEGSAQDGDPRQQPRHLL